MKHYCLILAVLLASCATLSPVGNSSYTIKKWTNKEQDQIALEVAKLPADSILIPAIIDYTRMRHEAE